MILFVNNFDFLAKKFDVFITIFLKKLCISS